MDYYYSASAARERLGIPVGAFYYLIETGKIKKLALPGKQQGVYSRHQIEKLLKEKDRVATDEREQKAVFLKATVDALAEECELATFILNGSTGYGLPSYTTWLNKNPDTNFIIKDQGRIVAFMHVIPVKRETIQKWVRGEIKGWEIKAEDILAYTPNSSMECIIMGIATTPDVDKQKRHAYGAQLLRGFTRFLHNLAKQNTTITKFYAMSTTDEASEILERAQFVEKNRIRKRVIFELDPKHADTVMAQTYRKHLTHLHLTL
jgi:hypothetical protein